MELVQVGQRVHSVLYGGRDGIIYQIEGEQRPDTIKSLGGGCGVMGGNADMYIVFDNGSQSCIPEAILHGVQWRIYDEIATDEEIQDALKFAVETEKERRRKAEAEKQRLEQERERISREFSQLIKVQDSRLGFYAVGAKNIKKELSQKFPGGAFSVKSDSYSGGCSIDITWTDGPTEKEVEAVSAKYKKGSFNGMEDIYEYDRSNVWPEIYGGADYVTPNRKYTKEAETLIFERLGMPVSYDSYGRYSLRSIPTGCGFTGRSASNRFTNVPGKSNLPPQRE